jgi:hypothetical protein
MISTTVTATARIAGSKVVHTVHAVRDGEPVKVYGSTRRSIHRYAYAVVRFVTVDGERAVIVDRWTNTNRARADQARIPVTWEARGEWGDVAVGDTVSTAGRHGAGQPAIHGRIVTRSADGGTVWIETTDGVTRERSISNVRRV